MSDDFERRWTTIELEQPAPPEGSWMVFRKSTFVKTGKDDILPSFRFMAAAQKAAKIGARYGLRAEREPSNRYDRNAIAIYGDAETQSWRLGYFDRLIASTIADKFNPEMPVIPHLFSFRYSDNGIFVKFAVMIPDTASRKANGWNKPK